MKKTFDQGWAADPFKEQLPELIDKDADYLDRVNKAITLLLMSDMITESQMNNIRQKRFPKLVSRYVNKARKEVGNDELRNPYVVTVGGNIHIKDALIGESIMKSAQLTPNQTSRAQEKENPIKGIALRFKGKPFPPFPASLKHGGVKKSEDLKIDDVVAVPLLGGIVTGRVTETQEDGFVAVHVDADMSLATKNWYFLERPL